MKYFIDTEFIESGPSFPLILVSIAIVAEDGRELYLVNEDAPLELANDWVKQNVIPHLGDPRIEAGDPKVSIKDLPARVLNFIGNGTPEFWGYYADYDWVVFCQIFGTMMDLPKGWPMYCRDLKQLCDSLGNPKLPAQISTEHNALNDAKWNKIAYEFLAPAPSPGVTSEQAKKRMMVERAANQTHPHEWSPDCRAMGCVDAESASLPALVNTAPPGNRIHSDLAHSVANRSLDHAANSAEVTVPGVEGMGAREFELEVWQKMPHIKHRGLGRSAGVVGRNAMGVCRSLCSLPTRSRRRRRDGAITSRANHRTLTGQNSSA